MKPDEPLESVSLVRESAREEPPKTRAIVRCENHPEVLADWQCDGCDSAWCSECAHLRETTAKVVLSQCPSCRERCSATPHLVRKRERAQGRTKEDLALSKVIPDAFVRPLSFWGVVIILFVGAFLAVASFVAVWVKLLFYPFYFSITRHVARGGEGIPAFEDYDDFFFDIVIPAVQFFLSYLVILVPAMLYLSFSGNGFLEGLGDPVFWILILAGVFYLPGVMIIVAMSRSLLNALNPLAPLLLVARLGTDYIVLFVFAFALFLTELVLPAVLPPPWKYAEHWLGVYFWMVTTGLAGSILRRRQARLGVEF